MNRFLLLLLFSTISCISLFAQSNVDWASLKFSNDSTFQKHQYQIKTNDENTIYGELLKLKNDQLIIRTNELGELSLDLSNIYSIIPHGDISKPPEMKMTGRNHYLLSPSPYGLDKAEFNFQNSEIFFLSGWYGITDNFTLGGGFTLLPGTKFDDQFFYLLPKFSIDLAPNIKASVQYTQLFYNGETEASLITLTTGFGSSDKHISIGYSTSLQYGEANAINLGGVLRVQKKFALITDSYFFQGDLESNIIGLGGRIIGASSSFDLGFLTSEGVSFPWFNYTVRF